MRKITVMTSWIRESLHSEREFMVSRNSFVGRALLLILISQVHAVHFWDEGRKEQCKRPNAGEPERHACGYYTTTRFSKKGDGSTHMDDCLLFLTLVSTFPAFRRLVGKRVTNMQKVRRVAKGKSPELIKQFPPEPKLWKPLDLHLRESHNPIPKETKKKAKVKPKPKDPKPKRKPWATLSEAIKSFERHWNQVHAKHKKRKAPRFQGKREKEKLRFPKKKLRFPRRARRESRFPNKGKRNSKK